MRDYFGLSRRNFLQLGCLFVPAARAMAGSDPWPPGDLMEPASLAKVLQSSGPQPKIICVAFPVLYRQRHIAGAELAGPGSKDEGLADLKQAMKGLSKEAEVVLYCGCCPMDHCPNIRPAYKTVSDLGFSRVRVLNLATSFHADWSAKGYPVEPVGKA